MRRAVAVVIHPGFQLLDTAGPATAFEIAERFRPGTYDLKLLAPGGGQVAAGIDLALALIEDDLGPEVARRTAQQLVVHQRRPGGQSQFSALVELGGQTGRFER